MNVLRQFISPSFWWSVIWRTALVLGSLFLGFVLLMFLGWVFMAHPGLW